MLKLVFLVSFIACLMGSAISHSLPQLDGRIVGGEETDISQYPYQLSLMKHGKHNCGASLISPTIAVTAAHCVDGTTPSILKVRAGSSSSNTGGIIVNVAEFVKHPEYVSITYKYDAAVLKLETPLPLGPNISVIQMVKKAPAEGTTAIVSGWGAEKFQAYTYPIMLRSVTVKIVSPEVCSSQAFSYGSAIKSAMICAAASGKDACQGDSGGPLAVNAGLAGIVSWGYGCAQKNYPGVYTDVAVVRSWILKTAAQLL